MKKRISFLLLALMPLFTYCDRDRVPNYVLNEEEFTNLIVDIHIAEATYGQKRGSYRSLDPEAFSYYKTVLEENNITKELLDTTIYWYSNHPKVYLKVYDRVIGRLSELEAEAENQIVLEQKKKEKEIEEMQEKMVRIEDLWQADRAYITSPKDTVDTNLPFDFVIDSLIKGSLSLKADYKFNADDLTRDNKMVLIVCYADSTMDTTSVDVKKSFKRRRNALLADLRDTINVLSLRGYLLQHEEKNKSSVIIENVMLEHMPNRAKN